jgi:hypothetical protein
MRKLNFRLRSLFFLAALVAICMWGWNERQRYLHEHVSVQVIDITTSIPISPFEYRTSIVTQHTGQTPDWTPWTIHSSPSMLSIAVPQNCRLFVEARIPNARGDESDPADEGAVNQSFTSELLVAPESNHLVSITMPAISQQSNVSPRFSEKDFSHGNHVLSGRVTDEHGNPIPAFSLLLDLRQHISAPLERYTIPVRHSDGRFELQCPKPVTSFLVEADSFARYRNPAVMLLGKPLDDANKDLAITLLKGNRLSGSIGLTPQHRGIVKVLLSEWSPELVQSMDFPVPSNPFVRFRSNEPFGTWRDEATCLKSAPDAQGQFVFEQLRAGTYMLAVLYNDQTVCYRPIVMDGYDRELTTIAIPPTGSIHGVIKEWTPRASNSTIQDNESPFLTSEAKPFEAYSLGRGTVPTSKIVRVDQLGRFQLDDVLIGTVNIGHTGGKWTKWNDRFSRQVLDVQRVVSEGKKSIAIADFAPVLELALDAEPTKLLQNAGAAFQAATLKSTDGAQIIAWIGNAKLTDQGKIMRVFADREMPTGDYTMEVRSEDGSSLRVQFTYQKNKRVQRVELVDYKITLDTSKIDAKSYSPISAHMIREGKDVATINFEDGYARCMFEDSKSVRIIAYQMKGCWAKIADVPISDGRIDLGGIEWEEGGDIELDIPLGELQALPDRLILRHEESGFEFEQNHLALKYMDEPIRLHNALPGFWTYALFSTDPIEGEKILLSHRFELATGKKVRYRGSAKR